MAAIGGGWKEVSRRLPTFLIFMSFIFFVTGALFSYGGFQQLKNDDFLRASGTAVSTKVEEVHVKISRTGRGVDKNETPHYTPFLRVTVNGKQYLLEPFDYTTTDKDRYSVGQTVTVMYDPANPEHRPGIKSDSARKDLLKTATLGVGMAALGVISLGTGATLAIRRKLTKRREAFEREGRVS